MLQASSSPVAPCRSVFRPALVAIALSCCLASGCNPPANLTKLDDGSYSARLKGTDAEVRTQIEQLLESPATVSRVSIESEVSDPSTIAPLKTVKSLRILEIFETDVSDEWLPTIATFEGLTELTCYDAFMSGASLAELAQLPKLRSLRLEGDVGTRGLCESVAMLKLDSLSIGAALTEIQTERLKSLVPRLEVQIIAWRVGLPIEAVSVPLSQSPEEWWPTIPTGLAVDADRGVRARVDGVEFLLEARPQIGTVLAVPLTNTTAEDKDIALSVVERALEEVGFRQMVHNAAVRNYLALPIQQRRNSWVRDLIWRLELAGIR